MRGSEKVCGLGVNWSVQIYHFATVIFNANGKESSDSSIQKSPGFVLAQPHAWPIQFALLIFE